MQILYGFFILSVNNENFKHKVVIIIKNIRFIFESQN